jgi:tetratricopeptide (TPR) repeat protein
VYTSRDVADLLGLSVEQVRRYARRGFLSLARGAHGEYRFSFRDLVLLRTARELLAARIPARTVHRSLQQLKDQLPSDRPVTELRITAEDDHVTVRDGNTVWNPESGQVQLDFAVRDLAAKVAPLARRAAADARKRDTDLGACQWYDLGCELEAVAPGEAKRAYRRALLLDPRHEDAHINLGRLLHEDGDVRKAEEHYRTALAVRPDSTTAAFNLGVALEDLRRLEAAAAAYRQVIATDPLFADAHYNLARLYERMGKPRAALRHYRSYKELTQSGRRSRRGA